MPQAGGRTTLGPSRACSPACAPSPTRCQSPVRSMGEGDPQLAGGLVGTTGILKDYSAHAESMLAMLDRIGSRGSARTQVESAVEPRPSMKLPSPSSPPVALLSRAPTEPAAALRQPSSPSGGAARPAERRLAGTSCQPRSPLLARIAGGCPSGGEAAPLSLKLGGGCQQLPGPPPSPPRDSEGCSSAPQYSKTLLPATLARRSARSTRLLGLRHSLDLPPARPAPLPTPPLPSVPTSLPPPQSPGCNENGTPPRRRSMSSFKLDRRSSGGDALLAAVAKDQQPAVEPSPTWPVGAAAARREQATHVTARLGSPGAALTTDAPAGVWRPRNNRSRSSSSGGSKIKRGEPASPPLYTMSLRTRGRLAQPMVLHSLVTTGYGRGSTPGESGGPPDRLAALSSYRRRRKPSSTSGQRARVVQR
eukprot:jgi/Tetstr1/446082/TSEL_033683.t1